ncbi:MAG: hypothetical protein M9887_04725 [Chitinophagales bacterium]|nr:hypothetical protein [Chitinophagales bacterium]
MRRRIKTYQLIVVITLALALIAQSFQKNIILINYSLDTAKYAASCENMDMPEMHCEGKCQVAHKMDETEQNDTNVPHAKIIEYVLFCENLYAVDFKNNEKNTHIYNSQYHPLADTQLEQSLMRPPITLV